MNSPAPFVFDGSIVVRTIDRNGDPWFVAADVCNALGIQNTTQAVENLDDDERFTLCLTEGKPRAGIPHSMVVVSESGLYTIILRSREAVIPGTRPHRFRKWVTSELIPSIRRTGSYSVLAEGSEREFLVQETESTMAELRARRDAMNLELRRLEKRLRRLGGGPPRLSSGRAYSPPNKLTDNDILDAIPAEGIRTRELERIVCGQFQVSHVTFYRHWRSILKAGRVRKEMAKERPNPILVFRA